MSNGVQTEMRMDKIYKRADMFEECKKMPLTKDNRKSYYDVCLGEKQTKNREKSARPKDTLD